MYAVYDCCTAEDVHTAARRVREMRREWFARPKKINSGPSPWAYLPNVPFENLVAAAYPSAYPMNATPTVKEIIVTVCRVFGCTAMDLASARRDRRIVVPRHLAMALAKRLTAQSYPVIGRRLGDRDHTSVMFAVRKMQPVIAAVELEVGMNASLDDWVRRCQHHAKVLNL